MSVVRADPSRAPLDAPASTKIASHTTTVRHGCRLLARAIDSGLSLIRSSPPSCRNLAFRRLTPYAYNVRSIGVRCKVSTPGTGRRFPDRQVSLTGMDGG